MMVINLESPFLSLDPLIIKANYTWSRYEDTIQSSPCSTQAQECWMSDNLWESQEREPTYPHYPCNAKLWKWFM